MRADIQILLQRLYIHPQMLGHLRYRILFALGLLVTMGGCQSLDDDSVYEIGTKASFFLVREPSANLSLYEYRDHVLQAGWNTKLNVANADLSDVELTDNSLWIASGPQKTIYEVGPNSASVLEKYAALPLAPHFIAVGAVQIMVADTAAHQLAFVKRRNGKVQVLEYDQKPGRCIYNSGKFYLIQNDTSLVIYDETAMTPRGTFALGMVVDELLLSKYHFPIVMGHDSASVRQALIDANGDFLVGGESYAVNYDKLRPTAYFAVRYGREYLRDLRMTAGRVTLDDLTLIADSVDDFDADFFEGTLFYQRDGSLVARDMAADSLIDSLPFQGRLLKAMHQYADE
jgi:hypothetical protein